jgi:hypothetical protein
MNPMGTPDECAAAVKWITPALIAQADEVRRNNWDWHPEANLPAHLSLVAFCDGIWIAQTGCLLSEVPRYARVADFGPVRRTFSDIEILTNERGEIPVDVDQRERPLVLRSTSDGADLAEVPAPLGGWTHGTVEAALDARCELIAKGQPVRAFIGDVELGETPRTWSLRKDGAAA